MPIEFNHTLVWSRDSKASATFLARMLGLPAPKRWGPFEVVTTDNGVNIDFMDEEDEIRTQHYAFLVSDADFDAIFGRIRDQGLSFWADPARSKPGEVNTHDNGRESTSRTRAATFWRSSPVPTGAADGIRHDVTVHGGSFMRFFTIVTLPLVWVMIMPWSSQASCGKAT